MNHKYSTFALLLFIFFIVAGAVLSELSSEEIDYVCSEPNSFLYRNETVWHCGNLTDTAVNLTVNNVTNLFTNRTIYWGQYHFDEFVDWNPIRDWLYNDTSGGLYFNESMLSTTYYNATEAVAIVGTIDSGTLVNTQHSDGNYDGVTFVFSEVAGSPGLDMRMNFTDITEFNGGVIRYNTTSLSGDSPVIQLWNDDGSQWESFPALSDSEDFVIITQPVFSDDRYINAEGRVQMRLYKSSNGNTNNQYRVDWVAISKGYGTPAGEEVDPYSWHRDFVGEIGDYYTSGNVNVTGNISTGWISLNNDSMIPDTNFVLRESDLVSSRTTAMDVEANISGGIGSPMDFKSFINSGASTVSPLGALVLTGSVDTLLDTNAQSQTIYGLNLDTGVDSASQSTGTRTFRGINLNTMSTLNEFTGGTMNVDGIYNSLGSVAEFGTTGNLNQYGMRIVRNLLVNPSSGVWKSYGLYIDGFSGGTGVTTEYALWIDDGVSTFKGLINSTSNILLSGDLNMGGDLNVTGALNVSGNITNQNMSIAQNSTTIWIAGGGKDICIGEPCSPS